jgi:general secretion pathway protein D
LEASQSLGSGRKVATRSGAYGAPTRGLPGEIALMDGVEPRRPLYTDGGETVTLNLVDVPIVTAANTIFTEILHAAFIVADDVTGSITLQTSRPVSKQALVDSFQSVLATKGLSISKSGDVYHIAPSADGAPGANLSFGSRDKVQVGTGARIVPLKSISAAEMERILSPIAPSGVLRADTKRNLLILTGTSEQIGSMEEAIELFDVDWMRGQSAAIFPLVGGGNPDTIAKQMEEVFGGAEGPAQGTVRFVPSRELNSILVIATNPLYLRRARSYINKMDYVASLNSTQSFVYKVENRPAKELAAIVQGMVTGESPAASSNGVASTLTPVEERMRGSDGGVADTSAGGLSASATALTSEASSFSAGKMMVVADEPNNALIIVATKAQYDKLLPILTSSDRMANQVLIEAVIAEVTLNDELKFGLRWFFENGQAGVKHRTLLTDAASGAVSAVAPGFSYLLAKTDFQVVLNALSSITDVKVISSPTLTVLDNRTARLQIGDQVPIVTQTASSTTASIDAPIVNQVEMKDTGVILSVTPRVNSNGHVLLNIEQEVSDVVRTTSSGIDSPTIRQRKIATTVVVEDGQSVTLGGLVQESTQKGTDAVPVLGQIPVLGAAFRNRSDTKKRTELVIFMRPRVMRNSSEAEAVTREFRNSLSRLGLDTGGTAVNRILR